MKRADLRVSSCMKHKDSGAGSVITSRSDQQPASGYRLISSSIQVKLSFAFPPITPPIAVYFYAHSILICQHTCGSVDCMCAMTIMYMAQGPNEMTFFWFFVVKYSREEKKTQSLHENGSSVCFMASGGGYTEVGGVVYWAPSLL